MNDQPDDTPEINPATGLPLIEDTFIDVGGSPYGTNIWQPTHDPEPSNNSPSGLGFDQW